MEIVATIGPLSTNYSTIKSIIEAGANLLRFNFALGSTEEMIERVDVAKKVISDHNYNNVKILADLPGCKIRVCDFIEGKLHINKKNKYIFKSCFELTSCKEFIPINYPNIGKCVSLDQLLIIGDGEIVFCIEEIYNDESFTAVALNSGVLRALNGISISGEIDKLNHFTSNTINHIKSLDYLRPDFVAFSFVRDADMVIKGKELIQHSCGINYKPKIVSKIETPLGIENFESIVGITDIILLARGDLAVYTDYSKLGIYQTKAIDICKLHKKKIIISTQVLESLVDRYFPTRSEVSDLTNIVLKGAHGIMLCKETVLPSEPSHTIEVAKKIISQALLAQGNERFYI
ncbi:pyruvate kinase [Fontibacillus solani]|uniref:Pyruvate kinase n=1 Tax=Fontibacillus solani TaxID=1572857 RepID=A0A7W3XSM1_9BACL|nr:pyruvate kinase [Fontibacillus solani]MBA9086867.1 pyruvate kinase [Fontibacillus solani]